jgi:MarR family transcriptional regulator, lower aerobic nicotinate degradation pathway regulator
MTTLGQATLVPMTTTGEPTVLGPVMAGPPRALVSSTPHLMKRLAMLQKERAIASFEETGLNPYHYSVLALLEEEPPETQAMIADALGYDRSHLVGVLDELEERRLIERKRDPGDRRRHLVTLTPDGKRAATKLRSIVRKLEDDFLAPLDDEERKSLHRLLLRLACYHDPRYDTARERSA